MSEKPSPMWRDALDVVVHSVSAECFRDELAGLREESGDDPDNAGMIYAGMLTSWFVESAGLFAALQLPADEVPATLAEIHETLAHLDFKKERKRLKRNERRYYDSFAHIAAPLFSKLGEAMEVLFNCYVAGDYDPETNPNDLIAEALEIAEEDLNHAHHLITQAGAIALHSRPLWWRWQVEAYGPADHWLVAIANLVGDYTGDGETPFGPLEQARAETKTALREVDEEIKEEEEEQFEPPVPLPSPVDGVIEELVEQNESPITPEQLALCQAHREEAIPAMLDLATDEYLQMEDSPGEGYAPIRAIQLLGELEAVEAIPTLIDIVADADPEVVVYSTAIHALQRIGQPALDPILTFMRYSWDVETKVGLAEAIYVADQGDERTYQTLAAVWEEASWEEGKCLLADALARTGGERAIPLLEAALEDPDLDVLMDYNEVAYALEKLGGEAPPEPIASPLFDIDAETFAHSILSDTSDPAHLEAFAEMLPEEWRSHPDSLAHTYTAAERNNLNSLIIVQTMSLPPEVSLPLLAPLLEAVETLTFDASTRGCARWLRKTYAHLAECAGPDLQLHLTGVLLSLQCYLSKDYDIADDPDQLLAAARELSPDDEKLRQLFGQVGALILHGRSCWPLWPAETDQPLSGWLEGLIEFCRPLERMGQIPLRSSPDPELETDELSVMLIEALEREKPPPSVTELLDLLIAQEQDSLSPKQRRRFAHQRAAVIPHLIRLVEDKRYRYENGPGKGQAAILAVQLLGELKTSQAADTLVNVVADSTPEDVIHDTALFSLMTIGRPALSSVQAYFRYGRDVETKTSLAEALGCAGRPSSDDFDLLRQVWEAADWTQNRRTVALAFGDLRDRRASRLLQAALEDRSADGLDLSYVHWALQQLGAPASPLPTKKSLRLNTPAPYNPRLIYDKSDTPQRLRYSAWNEPLCPDCGQPLVLDGSGNWTHPPEPPPHLPAPSEKKRRRKRKKRRR